MTDSVQDFTVNLAAEAAKIGPTPIEVAEARSLTTDMIMRSIMVIVVCAIFICLNWSVMSFVHEAFANDITRLNATPPMSAGDRLITSNVIMTLIGATVVQTGVGFIAILSYLFPKRTS